MHEPALSVPRGADKSVYQPVVTGLYMHLRGESIGLPPHILHALHGLLAFFPRLTRTRIDNRSSHGVVHVQ